MAPVLQELTAWSGRQTGTRNMPPSFGKRHRKVSIGFCGSPEQEQLAQPKCFKEGTLEERRPQFNVKGYAMALW